MFNDAFEQVYLFTERGGDVVLAILGVILLLWFFILERVAYFSFSHKAVLAGAVNEWEKRLERKSWQAHQIRYDLVATVEIALETNTRTIQMLVGVCPLFGLLGTVTGMIEVFDVMAFFGNGSPRAMASGISKATIPTMAGMVGALTGVFAISMIQRFVRRQKAHLEDKLTFDH